MKRRKDQSGYTLTEMLIVLFLMALVLGGIVAVSVNVVSSANRRAFDEECEMIFNTVSDTRDLAIMMGCETLCQFKNTYMIQQTYENGKSKKTRIDYETFTATPVTTIVFTADGIIQQGATVTLRPTSGKIRQLVFQPVSGRIYLTE